MRALERPVLVPLGTLVPQGHFYRHLEATLDLAFVRYLVHDRYSGGADNQNCLRAAVVMFKDNWDAVIVEILELRSTSGTIIRTMGVYNPYVDED